MTNHNCNRCNKFPCGCNILVPIPFWGQAAMSCEDHRFAQVYQQTSPGITFGSSWNIPQCGGSAIVSAPNTFSVPVGAYIWSKTYGYFEIISYDSSQGLVSLSNPCLSGNEAPGTEIPQCTTFTVNPPPCCADQLQSGDFVKYDFTAPIEGDCLDITLTSIDGLIAGNNIQIGSGIYSLSEIKSGDIINICNNGNGIVPGTPVIAQNLAGQYQYPVHLLTVSPCATLISTSGVLTVCDSGVPKTITGASNGMVFTLTNNVTGVGHYATLPSPPTPCCEDLSGGIISNTSANFPTSISVGDDPVTCNTANVTINNPSTTHAESVMFAIEGYTIMSMTDTGPTVSQMDYTINVDFNGGGPVAVRGITNVMPVSTAIEPFTYSQQVLYNFVVSIPASTSYNLQASFTISTFGPSCDISTFITKIDAIGVAV